MPDFEEHSRLIRFAYQDAHRYMELQKQHGPLASEATSAYASFRSSCRNAGLNYHQVLSEVRREKWRKDWKERVKSLPEESESPSKPEFKGRLALLRDGDRLV